MTVSRFWVFAVCALVLRAWGLLPPARGADVEVVRAEFFTNSIRPLFNSYCLKCHSTEKKKGEMDLEQFSSLNEVLRHPKVWQAVIEQLGNNEMPPKEKPQPTSAERERLIAWANAILEQLAQAHAGDPGPVVLRRLSNAEYTYTIRDLTSVESLDPAREFPVDGAAGEGFMNTGNALVMSPSLLTKYLDAGKELASHAVLLSDGFRFSPKTTRRDWTEEILAQIRAFYHEFTDPRGGDKVNLQGIVFETNEGGRLPLEKYLAATLELRGSLPASERKTVPVSKFQEIAGQRGLTAKYLRELWNVLNANDPSLILDGIRARWQSAKPGDEASLAEEVGQWQKALWKFASVGHIGKLNGPKAWMEPVNPITTRQELRLQLSATTNQSITTLYLLASDAGDGNAGDFVVWEQPRLIAPGQPDLFLRDVRAVADRLGQHRDRIIATAAQALKAAEEATRPNGAGASPARVEGLARKHGVDKDILSAWLNYLGIGTGDAVQIEGYFTNTLTSTSGYDFIQGWGSPQTPSLVANSSTQHVRIPGNMKPRGVAVHPSPKLQAVVGWRSPTNGLFRVKAKVTHAHPECGNGITWSLELRRGVTRQRLAAGTAQGSKTVNVGPFDKVRIQPGDLVSLAIGPRGDHSCDLTDIELVLRPEETGVKWSLTKDVSKDVLAGNPHADRFGNSGVWHFYTEPVAAGSEIGPVIPPGSLLARWKEVETEDEKRLIAEEVQALLASGPPTGTNSPDAQLYRQLTSLGGPLLAPFLGQASRLPTDTASPGSLSKWGLDPAMFGHRPNSKETDSATARLGAWKPNPLDLCAQAPSMIEIRLPSELVTGRAFVTTGRLDPEIGKEGSVQLQVLTTKPERERGLLPTATTVGKANGPWTSDNRQISHASPILVTENSAAGKRVESAFEEFRRIFPAALCYTKIVPVDEVVTLTLFYREDHHLARLMLDDAQKAKLDRLWDELHYVSHDALTLVDAFEQIWQFATQDADPKVFEPLRKPINDRAAAFRQRLLDTQPKHLDAVLEFADRAYRRPLTSEEKDELRGLYKKLRAQDLPHDEAVRLALARVFVAPAFLYHLETAPPGSKPGPISEWELANRLSYFLWSSLPDDELRRAASSGELSTKREARATVPEGIKAASNLHTFEFVSLDKSSSLSPGVRGTGAPESPPTNEKPVTQARRMLRDERVRRLATEFGCQWLHIRDFDALDEKSERHFPTFAGLRGAMYEEAIRFFTDLFQNDGSILDLLDADYTFLNEALARHYEIPGVSGEDWRRVEGVKKFSRGGILGLGATLAKQSGASRTSPILRGNWVAEALLGDKLPRPPKDVPRLPEDEAAIEGMTVRQLVEKHTTDPLCSKCHVRIDPFGYALESFDAIGRHREKDLGDRPIDTHAKVMDGSQFEGIAGLREYLLTKRREAFVQQFCRKLLGYALGRAVQLSDRPLLAEMRQQLQENNYHFSAVVETIVRSKQFQQIRGRDAAYEE